METLITVLVVLAAIVMVLVVLIQNSKGGGLAANFSSSNQIMGVRKTTDFLEKATWGLACFIIALSILGAGLKKAGSGTSEETISVSAPAKTAPSSTTAPEVTLPTATTPAAPATPAATPAQ